MYSEHYAKYSCDHGKLLRNDIEIFCTTIASKVDNVLEVDNIFKKSNIARILKNIKDKLQWQRWKTLILLAENKWAFL